MSSTQNMPMSPDFPELPTMPIALVGMACRLSGGSDTPSKFWDMLMNKRSGFSTDAGNRFNHKAHWHPQNDMNGTLSPKGAHFIQEDLGRFDAPFFNISAAEATAMDPQQRLALEVAFEALESAGLPMTNIAGSKTSVYASTYNKDYAFITSRDPEATPKYQALGIGDALMSNRISYFFDLKGPSFTLDTGSSGSLVALHQACQSIRTGEASMSIVVGANLILDPCFMVSMSNMGYFSDDGRCFSFDARGNGYGRGEGMAAVIVKPLHQALADGDPIRAVIRNTHVNQDGRTPGITLPSQQAQATMIREAYTQAGLDMKDTAYFESHGTGTPAGDPIEAAAIGSTLGAARHTGEQLYVGTAKSNLGHTEACASVAGLIKVAVSLENATIVPNYDFQTPNPDIPFKEYKLVVPTEVLPWPSNGVRRASINAFGYGGTNAHAIVESYESFMRNNIRPALTPPLEKQIAGLGKSEHLLVVSAKTSAALQGRLEALAGYLQSNDTVKLDSLAYTLAQRRSHMSKRAFVIATSIGDAVQQLKKPITLPSTTSSTEQAQIAFCFTGQGAQWAGMGLGLIDRFPVAQLTFERCTKVIRDLGASWNPIEELHRNSEDSNISNAELSQPLCTALQITLVELLRSAGIRPDAGVFGHSSGEIAAAYAADLLSLEDAMTASYFRGLWCSKLSELAPSVKGAMIAVGLSEAEFEPYLASLKLAGLQASVACVNSPSSITVSGDRVAIQQVKVWMDEAGTFARELRVDTAYHSHHMLHVAEQYRESMAKIAPNAAATTQFFSSVHGKELGHVPVGADYWVTNMVSQVKFLQAVEAFAQARSAQETETIVIEIGPHSALAGPLKEILRQPELPVSSISYLPSLVRKQSGSTSLLTLLGQLYLRRVDIDFSVTSTGTEQVLHDLPKYSWDRSTRYWQESRLSSDYRLREQPRHQLLGIRSADFNPFEPSWRLILRPNEQPWLRGHTVHGQILYPAGGFLATALQACKEYADLHLAERDVPSHYVLKDVEIRETLLIPESHEGVEMQTILRKSRRAADSVNAVQLEFTIYSCTNDKTWSENCLGTAVIDFGQVEQAVHDKAHENLNTTQKRLGHRIFSTGVPEFYQRLARIGYEFQAPFQNLTDIYADHSQAVASIVVPNTAAHMPKAFELPQIIHAATADSLVSSAFPALFNNGLQACLVPTHIDSLTISASTKHIPGEEMHVAATVVSAEQRTSRANVFAVGGETIVHIVGLEYTALPGTKGNLLADPTSIVHKIVSEPDPAHLTSKVLRKLTPAREATPNYDSAHVQLFDEACYRFAVKALGELQDWLPTEKTPSHMAKLIAYLKGQLGSDLTRPFSELPEAILRNKVTNANSVGEMIYRVGERLTEIIRGDIDSLSIMLQDNLLNSYYQDDMVKRCYPTLHRYVQLLQHKNPSMRVLEIGAGTGGATRHVLQALDNKYQQYDFTDISSGFFLKAEEDFATPRSSIEFKKLNIELDPVQQGFVQGSYDLIVAANVLHATKSMDHTMRNVRSLLKPGGTLLLMEITAIKLYTGLIFGCLPGWWLSEEDWRDNGPQMDRGRWTSVLKSTGFSGVEAHYPDFDAAELRQTEIMVSTALESVTPNATTGNLSVKVRAQTNREQAESLRLLVAQQSDLTANNASAVLLVLDDGEQSLLENLSKNDFDALKKDLTEAKSVVWLANKSSSSAAAAQGLLRTLHSETGVQTQFIALDDAELQDATRLIAVAERAVAPIRSEAQASLEEDFVASDGLLSIPRLVEDNAVNEYVMAATSGTGAFDTAAPWFRPDATYLISGGLGGLGRATTEWMIRNGAKNIAILTRTLPETGSTRDLWHRETLASGADVRIFECNVADASALQGTLDIIARELPPIRGVVQGAMTLVDSTFQNMSHEAWETTLRPKLQGSWNLHQLIPNQYDLDFFVLLSSIAGLIGNAGQANYAAACTYQDSLARQRVASGLKGVSLDLGIIEDAGFVAERADAANNAKREGFVTVKLPWLFRLLARVIANPPTSPNDAQIVIGLKTGSNAWSNPLFHHLAVTERLQFDTQRDAKAANSAKDRIAVAEGPTEIRSIVLDAFTAHVSKLLAVPTENIAADLRLTDLGADSLVAVELRSWIKRELETDVKVLEILGGDSIGKLIDRIVKGRKVVA